MTSPETLTNPTRRRRRGSELVINDLLDAALVEFAAHGFDGASTRAIAERAGAHQPQINYFFSSKEQLWQAAANRVFALLDEAIDEPLRAVAQQHGQSEGDLVEAFTDAIRSFVRFSARRPDLHRIMNLEATSDSPRLRWLVDTHVRPRFARLAEGWEIMRDTGAAADLSAVEAFQLVIGFGALPYANEPMLNQLHHSGSSQAAQVDAQAELLVTLLLPGRVRRPTQRPTQRQRGNRQP